MFTKNYKSKKRFAITIFATCAAATLALYCSSLDFENPIDPKFSYTLTVNVGEGGSVLISPEQESYAGGTEVRITAQPNLSDNYISIFNGWSGASTSTNSTVTVLMDADKTLTVNFRIIERQQEHGSVTDSRDGQTYRTVKIGSQTWMAENLNFETSSGSWCYNNNSSNCDIYGRLYDWNTALTVCPDGWHLPTDAEWTTLVNFVANFADVSSSRAGWLLKATSFNGVDAFGFSALPGGRRWVGSFHHVGLNGYWWAATEVVATLARFRVMYDNRVDVDSDWYNKTDGFSVRCVRD